MPRLPTLWAAATAGLLGLAACGGEAPPPPPARAAVTPVPFPQTPADSLCPKDGQWRDCHLVDRILKAGLAFEASGDTVRQPFLVPPGVVYAIGSRSRLIAFFYGDSAAVAADLGALDTLRLRPRGDTLSPWAADPHPIRSANLLAVLFAENPRTVERIRLAITAGPPQPASAAPPP